MIVGRYSLVVEGPRDGDDEGWLRLGDRVRADLPAMVEEMEENLSDLLPEGYTARIEEVRDE